jgi:hypothetical protein
MNRYGSGFREPPWVMGSPKEVMDWVEGSHPSKKKEDKHSFEKKYLTNLHIKFDFDVEKRVVKSSKFFGFKKIEEKFDLLQTTELVLRGLAKAKFRNTAKIVIDGKTVYEHPEKKSDLRKTIENISDFSDLISVAKNVEIVAILADVEKCNATIKINKVHGIKEHSVDINIKGKIHSDIYHTFLNYLKENIGLKEESS